MKNLMLLIACLFTVGAQVCFGAERIESKKPLMVKISERPGKKRTQATPHYKANAQTISRLAKINAAVKDQLVSDEEVAVEPTVTADSVVEKPRVTLHASGAPEIAMDFKNGAFHHPQNSLTMWEGSASEVELSKELSAVDLSPTRDMATPIWSEVRTARAQTVTGPDPVVAERSAQRAAAKKAPSFLRDIDSIREARRERSRTVASE